MCRRKKTAVAPVGDRRLVCLLQESVYYKERPGAKGYRADRS